MSKVIVTEQYLSDIADAIRERLGVYVRSRGSNYYAYCGQLTIVQTA